MKNSRLMSRILGIALAFVLIGAMLPLGALTGHSKVWAAPATIHVPDDYLTIQGAVDAASPGDTIIVRDGTYVENVKVNKDHLTIESEDGADVTIVQAANPNDHVFVVSADYVSISGFTAEGASGGGLAGILIAGSELGHVEHSNIYSNKVTNNCNGIILNYSNSNRLENNIANRNKLYGIRLSNSHDSIITNNEASHNRYGIYLTMGISLVYSTRNAVINNRTSSNSGYGIFLTYSDYNTVIDNVGVSNTDAGVRLSNSNNNKIAHNSIESTFWDGIVLSRSSNNTLTYNTVRSSGRYAIHFSQSDSNRTYLNDLAGTPVAPGPSFLNTWHSPDEVTYIFNGNTYTSYLGNHWSGYYGIDADGDGVGDTPYTLSHMEDRDDYPLMEPFGNYVIGEPEEPDIPRFLTLPFSDPDVKIQDAWRSIFERSLDPDDPYAHKGTDYINGVLDQAATWQPFDVVAAADGVAMHSSGGGYGDFVLIRHNETDPEDRNYFTLYGHLGDIEDNITHRVDRSATDYENWTPVTRGQRIGVAGDTGSPDLIHLHFEVQRGSYAQNKVDPYDIYNRRDYYPGGGMYTGCGDNSLWLETVCPPPSEAGRIILIEPLNITPADPCFVGDSLTATFTVKNVGDASITLDILLLGGRYNKWELPGGGFPDFTYQTVTLQPEEMHEYEGTFTIPEPGDYHFFIAYYIENPTEAEKGFLDENNWNTSVDVEIDGQIIADPDEARGYRERKIVVVTYTDPLPPPLLWERISGPWEEDTWDIAKSLSQIAVDPSNPETTYAVVEHDHYYLGYRGDKIHESTDGGGNWNPINEGLPGVLWSEYYWPIGTMAIAPSNPDVIYIGTSAFDPYWDAFPTAKGVYTSTNGGLDWISVDGPYYTTWWIFKSYHPISSMVVHPTNPDVVYAGTIGGGIWRTTNGGESWEKIWEHDTAKSLDINTLAVSHADPNIIYAAAYNVCPFGSVLVPNLLIKSMDGGASWETLIFYWKKIDDIAVDGKNANMVNVITEYFEVYRSTDGGTNWDDASGTAGTNPLPSPMWLGPTLGRSNYMVLHPDFSNVMYVARKWEYGGVYFSPDTGENWFPFGDLAGRNVKELVLASDAHSHVLYAGTRDALYKVDIPSAVIIAQQNSPGELRIYDSEGRVTGLVDGEAKGEIPRSLYDEESKIVSIFDALDSYRYEVVGTDEGAYGLSVTSAEGGQTTRFSAIDIPISPGAIHQYTIEWEALAQGEDGVTVQVDSDGDGVFEDSFATGSELTGDQFILHTETLIDFDPDVLSLRARGGLVTAYIELPEGFDVNNIDISTILLNGTVPALSWPTAIGDYNANGIPDLMVKFDRRAVQAILDVGRSVEITIIGEVGGIPFMGTDTIQVINW